MNASKLTEGQRAYEAKRAKKAGMSLEKWLAQKEKRAREEAVATRAPDPTPPKKPGLFSRLPGFFSRLLERAQKPFS